MSLSINRIFIAGNLTADPTLKYIASGAAVCTFDVASNRKFKGKDGKLAEEVLFIRVSVWDKVGENCAKFLSKGRPVLVEGRLKSRSWTTDAGEKRTAFDVVADHVHFLGSPKDSNEVKPSSDVGTDMPIEMGDQEIPF